MVAELSRATTRCAQIHARFARKLPQRVERVRAAVAQAAETGSAADLEQARREAHKLAGTAACFGQLPVSEIMRTVELALDEYPVNWARVMVQTSRAMPFAVYAAAFREQPVDLPVARTTEPERLRAATLPAD